MGRVQKSDCTGTSLISPKSAPLQLLLFSLLSECPSFLLDRQCLSIFVSAEERQLTQIEPSRSTHQHFQLWKTPLRFSIPQQRVYPQVSQPYTKQSSSFLRAVWHQHRALHRALKCYQQFRLHPLCPVLPDLAASIGANYMHGPFAHQRHW